MICVYGDLHLSDNRPWSYEVSREVVKYITSHKYNNPDNSLVLLGDLTESAFLSGLLYDLLLNMFLALKYKDVYVIVGNHDKKPNKQGKLSLSYRFLQNRNIKKIFTNSNIHIIDSISIQDIEGIKCLMMPYVFNDSGTTLQYYENLSDEYRQNYDIIFGHFSDTSNIDINDKHIDISYLHSQYVCLGHSHNPGGHYIGSVIPNSISEANKDRVFYTYTRVDSSTIFQSTETLPIICDYYSFTFPEPLPNVPAMYPIWTVNNCASNEIAFEQYGNIYISKCLYKSTIDIEGLNSLGVLGIKEAFTNDRLFEEYIESKPQYTFTLLQRAKKYLQSM